MSQRKELKCKSSSLLTPEENQEIAKMLKHKCISIETTVIQLYNTRPPNHSDWIYKDCGVLCFIQDSKRKRYFFRLYCLVRRSMIWEHKVDTDIDYTYLKTFLSSFHGEECIFAFNFASKVEASTFNACVLEKITAGCKILPKHERKIKAKLSKKDISAPIEPQHTFHVGFKNMDIFKLSPADIQSFFEKKNINRRTFHTKPIVVESSVTPISIFQNTSQQDITAKAKLKASSSFSTFHDDQQHLATNTRKFNHSHKFPMSTLSSPRLKNKSRPIPPPKPLQRPTHLSSDIQKHNLTPELPTTYDKGFPSQNEIMSIDNSLAILSEISEFLDNISDRKPTLPFQQNETLASRDQELKEILERRFQYTQSCSDSSFDSDSDDTWDD